MKLHHTEYKKNYEKYILDTIETGLNDEPLKGKTIRVYKQNSAEHFAEIMAGFP